MGNRRLACLDLEETEEDYWEEEEDLYYEEEYENAPCKEPTAGKPAQSEEHGVEDCIAADVCAVCLSTIEPENLAIIKGCEHEYCVNCILQWAMCREAPTCPQCKAPFNYLYTHRLLDGQLSDCPVEESVCLLKRATWFVDHVKTLEKGKAVSASMAEEGPGVDWAELQQFYQYDDEDDYDEDEIEKYYFSSAAGRARVVLGNRRLGENGYMRAGRMYARPANGGNNGEGGSSGAGGSGSNNGQIGKAGKGRAGAGKPGGEGGPSGSAAGGSGSRGPVAAAAGAGPSGSGSVGQPAAKGPGQGRRAKRNARRAAADLGDLRLDDY